MFLFKQVSNVVSTKAWISQKLKQTTKASVEFETALETIW